MPNWREYDSLENAIARVGGDVVDVIARLVEMGVDSDPVMRAGQILTDQMRNARQAAHDAVVQERGHRR